MGEKVEKNGEEMILHSIKKETIYCNKGIKSRRISDIYTM